MIGDRQQRVRIGWQIDPDHTGFLVDDMIDKTGILMGKAVMILSPDMRGQQIVQRCYRTAPGDLIVGYLQPFCMLIEHRINDMDKGLIAGKKSMTSGQQISFKPTLAGMLGEYFHDSPTG